jgi:hypothetical protein
MRVIPGPLHEDDERGGSKTYLWRQLIANALNGIGIQNLLAVYCTLLTDKIDLLVSSA